MNSKGCDVLGCCYTVVCLPYFSTKGDVNKGNYLAVTAQKDK